MKSNLSNRSVSLKTFQMIKHCIAVNNFAIWTILQLGSYRGDIYFSFCYNNNEVNGRNTLPKPKIIYQECLLASISQFGALPDDIRPVTFSKNQVWTNFELRCNFVQINWKAAHVAMQPCNFEQVITVRIFNFFPRSNRSWNIQLWMGLLSCVAGRAEPPFFELGVLKCWPEDGARGKVRGSS